MSTLTRHLVLSRALVYQATSVLAVAGGAVSSYALKTYANQRNLAALYGATLSTTPIFAAGGMVVAAEVLAGTACGLLCLAVTLRPGYSETRHSVVATEVGVLSLFMLVAAINATVVMARDSAALDTHRLSPAKVAALQTALGSLKYSASPSTLAYVVLAWLSAIGLALSALIASLAERHLLMSGEAEDVDESWPEKRSDDILRLRKSRTAEMISENNSAGSSTGT